MKTSMDVREGRLVHTVANPQLSHKRNSRLRIATHPGVDGVKDRHLEPDQILLRAFRDSGRAINPRALWPAVFAAKDAPAKLVEALLMICLSFLIMAIYYKAEDLDASIAAYPRLKWLDSIRRFMARYRKNVSKP